MFGIAACVPRLGKTWSPASTRVPPSFKCTWRVFGCQKTPSPHDQFGAACLVVLQMQSNLAIDHVLLALPNLSHVGRDRTGDHRAERCGVMRQMRDPCAPDLILAGQAGDVGTGAPNLPPNPLPRIRTSNCSG